MRNDMNKRKKRIYIAGTNRKTIAKNSSTKYREATCLCNETGEFAEFATPNGIVSTVSTGVTARTQ